LNVSGVDDDFSADIPLHCKAAGSKEQIDWVRAVTGANVVVPKAPRETCRLPAMDEFLYQP
jgi:hypothetical protein